MSVFITNMGTISSLGKNVNETYQSLINLKSGIKEVSFPNLNTKYFVGKVDLTNEELAALGNYKNHSISRSSLLGIVAAKECWGDNQIDKSIKTGFISGTSVGGMDKSEVFYRDYLKETDTSIANILHHDSGSTTERIADELGIQDYVNTISTACSSSSNAIMHGARLIKSGKLDRVIVGGADALTEFTISGFNSLMIYNDKWCQPFDENRNGLNLGEGAAFLMLENEKSIAFSKNIKLAKVSGYNNSSDAFHQTATSPDAKGATIAMTEALKVANLSPADINYINAHGTGTKNNDLTESIAFKNLFKTSIPKFSSTKSYTGHTLAASGSIEAIFSVLAIKNNVAYPNLNFQNKIEECDVAPLANLDYSEINHVMSNALGFGGNCTSLIFSKIIE